MWSANVAGRVPVEGPFLQPPEGHVGSPEDGSHLLDFTLRKFEACSQILCCDGTLFVAVKNEQQYIPRGMSCGIFM